MDNRAEVREFLMSRRAKTTPDRVGLPTHGTRRVPGLRRSEVAALAGLSVEYYSKLERGAIGGASAAVLEALAEALLLNDTERGLPTIAESRTSSANSRHRARRSEPCGPNMMSARTGRG